MATVVVVGGGFGGAYAARSLLRRTAGRVDVTLVSRDNFMLFTPLLPEAASGSVEPRHVVVPLRQMCRGARLVVGEVTGIDRDARTVHVRREQGRAGAQPLADVDLRFDGLVLAPGGVPRLADVPGLVEAAIGARTLEEAIWLRNHVLAVLEQADAETDPERRCRLLSFVFVGGGYAGVEMLAELEDMAAGALHFYPRIERSDLRWVLVEASPRILGELPARLGAYARRQLEDRRIEVRTATTLTAATAQGVTLSTGEEIGCETLVWAAGVVGSPLVAALGAPLDARGRVIVDAHLRVPGTERIWALGDCAAVPNAADGGRPCPPTSQHALREAWAVARNVAAAFGHGEAAPFRYRALGGLATLGLRKGVAQILGIRVRGLPAWFAARTYHLLALPTVGRRLRVVLDWTVQLVSPRDVVQLGRLGRPARLDRQGPPP
jgi:NADH dehydrogenase